MPKQQSKDENGSVSATMPPSNTAVSKFQAFTTATVHRSQLKGAPYNPRHLSARAKAKIRGSIERVGLVQPIVWNKRTGNIVGGHQRIGQIDALEGTNDYSLTVAVVDVDEKREKELNILLNNTEVSGEWDMEKLKAMLDSEIDLLATGFDHAEFMKLFGEAPSQANSDHQEELNNQLKDVKAAYEKLSKMNRTKDDKDFYCVVVFGSYNERKEFLDAFGFEDNRYIDGRTLTEIHVENAKLPAKGAKGNKKVGVTEDKTIVTEKPL